MAAKKFLRLIAGIATEIFGVQSSAGAANAGDLVSLDDNGRISSDMMPVGFGAETKVIVASEALAAGDFVNVFLSGGVVKVRKADATSAAKRAHGYVLAAVLSSGNATVYYGNLNNQVTGRTIGATQWLSETTPGSTQETAPTGSSSISQILGVATGAAEMLVGIEPVYQLAA